MNGQNLVSMLQLRVATMEDVPVIEKLVVQTYTKYLERMDVSPGPMRDDYNLRVKEGGVWLLDDAVGETIALLILIPKEDHLLLDNIAVAEDWQNRGLGKRLFSFAEREAARLGFDELKLYTAEAMYENIDIYKKWGWIEYDRFKQNGYQRVFMRKPVPEAERLAEEALV